MRTSDIYLLSLTTWAPLQFAKGERINGEGFCPFVFRRFVEPGRIYLLTLILSSASGGEEKPRSLVRTAIPLRGTI